MTDRVLTQISETSIATVTLNAPEKHNAFDDETIAALHDSFRTLAGNDTVRAVVLASEGKSFSAGADLNWMKAMASYDYARNEADARALANMLHALYSLPQPTIARVQGAAFGGGVGLVSCCDIAIASSAAAGGNGTAAAAAAYRLTRHKTSAVRARSFATDGSKNKICAHRR